MSGVSEQEPALEERHQVYLNRYREAREYGLTQLEARLFADSDIDIGALRRLARLGCPPLIGAKLLL
jgi:hypothetical protein